MCLYKVNYLAIIFTVHISTSLYLYFIILMSLNINFVADEAPDILPLYTTLTLMSTKCTYCLHSNSFAFATNKGDAHPLPDCQVWPLCLSLWLLRFIGSSEEMEELWIYRALNVCVNDQSQPAELEKRRRKKRDRVMDKRRMQEWRELKEKGRAVIYSGWCSPSHSLSSLPSRHRYSSLIKAIHHIDLLPLPSKAKITQSSPDVHSLALEDYSIQL